MPIRRSLERTHPGHDVSSLGDGTEVQTFLNEHDPGSRKVQFCLGLVSIRSLVGWSLFMSSEPMQYLRSWSRAGLVLTVVTLSLQVALTFPVPDARAQEQAVPAKKLPATPLDDGPVGQFLTLNGNIDSKEFAKVMRVAKTLQSKAREEKRKGILILEFADGPSRFGDVRELAKYLSEQLPDIRTVAWVPKDVRGFNVIPILACNEIIMHSRAGLGDVGRNKPVDEDVKIYIDTLVSRRHNPLLSQALVHGMLDPKEEVIWVRKQVGNDAKAVSETELVTPQQFQRLMDAKAIIQEHKTVKAAGTAGLFNGGQARAGGYLCSQTVEARADIAKIYGLKREALREDPTAMDGLIVRRIRIEGVITPLVEEFINRQIERMLGEGANLLIFEIDSPGGVLYSSQNLANRIADLDPKKVRSVAYIPKQALSGAAMIALGCDDIVMHPGAQIGDSAPIEVKANGPFERAPEKVLSIVRTIMKTLAEKKSRPPAITIAMADKDHAVYKVTNKDSGEENFMSEDDIHAANGEWIKGQRVDESGRGNLLTVNGKRAQELKIAEEPVENFDELKQRYAIPAEELVPAVGPTWVDSLVFILNNGQVTGFLFVIGIICIYAELHVPSGFFLIISCMCFGLFFWSRFLGGTAGWLEVMLFLLGLCFIALEVFVVPGFGVFGVSGALMVLASLVLASQTFFIPSSSSDYRELADHLSTLGGSLVGVVLAAFVLSRFLPKMPLLTRMVLVPPGAIPVSKNNEPLLRPDMSGSYSHPILNPNSTLIGQRGLALSILRPSGKAQFGDRLVDVVSEGPFIEVGSQIQVIEVNGNRVVVRELV